MKQSILNLIFSLLSFAIGYGIALLTGLELIQQAVLIAYVIQWNGGAIGGNSPKDTLNTTTSLITYYTVENLKRGNNYIFVVKAINFVGSGPQSDILNLTAC